MKAPNAFQSWSGGNSDLLNSAVAAIFHSICTIAWGDDLRVLRVVTLSLQAKFAPLAAVFVVAPDAGCTNSGQAAVDGLHLLENTGVIFARNFLTLALAGVCSLVLWPLPSFAGWRCEPGLKPDPERTVLETELSQGAATVFSKALVEENR